LAIFTVYACFFTASNSDPGFISRQNVNRVSISIESSKIEMRQGVIANSNDRLATCGTTII
jgi:hypothetical protein